MPRTLFGCLIKASGMSVPEVAAYLERKQETVRAWMSGRNPTPEPVMDKMMDLVDEIDTAATSHLGDGTHVIVHIRPTDDVEYIRDLGWPGKGAYDSVLSLAAFRALKAGHEVKVFPL